MGYIGGRAVPVIDFWKTLQSEPEKGKAPVVRLTHVKNLDSSLAHEYLQLIIVTEKGRERVVVERTDPDQFIFNGEWKMPKLKWFPDPLNLAKTDLPLPLYSLGWEESKAPTLAQITDICKATHDSAPDYSLIKGKHCYWYALVVYEAVKRAYPGEEKQWRFSFARGMPTFLGDATLMKGDAAAFQKERATGMSADTSGDPTPKDAADETAKSLQKALKEAPEEFKEEYTQELAPEEVVQTSIVDDLDISTKPQEHLAAPAEASPWDILEGYSVLINAMNEDPKRDEYIGIARDAEIAYNNKDRAPTDPIMISPYSDEYGYDKVTKDSYEMRNATDALIGKVLKQVGVTPKVEPPSVVSDA